MNALAPAGLSCSRALEYHQIVRLVPYRSPWLLIDRVLDWGDSRIVVQKAISGADPMMAAHLADGPSIMPGVLYIELVGQATMLLGELRRGPRARDSAEAGSMSAVLARCKGEFLSPAYIGELITAEVRIVDEIANKTVYEGVVKAQERLVCRVSGMGAMVSRSDANPADVGGAHD